MEIVLDRGNGFIYLIHDITDAHIAGTPHGLKYTCLCCLDFWGNFLPLARGGHIRLHSGSPEAAYYSKPDRSTGVRPRCSRSGPPTPSAEASTTAHSPSTFPSKMMDISKEQGSTAATCHQDLLNLLTPLFKFFTIISINNLLVPVAKNLANTLLFVLHSDIVLVIAGVK